MRRPADDQDITYALQWLVIGVVLVAISVAIGVQVATETDVDVDAWWNSYVASFAPALLPLSLFMNAVGGGWLGVLLIPGIIAIALLASRRPWSALFFIAASAASAVVVQVLKGIFDRVRPEDMLVLSDHGSYPSGHTANAATIAVVAVVLFPRLWVAAVGSGWVLLMAFGRTQVHAHWLSDTVGGALVGAGMALVIAAAFAIPVLRERRGTVAARGVRVAEEVS